MRDMLHPSTKPLITITEARKLLGSDSKYMNDDQVQDIISTLTLIAREYLNNSSSNNHYGNAKIEQ